MPAHQLRRDAGRDVMDVEPGAVGALGGHPGVKQHLQQQVTEFLAQVGQIASVEGVKRLVGLFEQVGRE